LRAGRGLRISPPLPVGNGRLRKDRVMKKGIHPDYHFVEVQLNDGTTYKTRTTYGTAGQKITLDIDPSTHPAWTGGQQQLMDRGGRLTRFNKKFAGFVKG
jgi:large subunit ribosomal protein L31